MTTWVTLLRAVNVGGTGNLPMTDLVRLCQSCGFTNVTTYIASGNALFEAGSDQTAVRTPLEAALANYAGKPIGVLLRSAAEIAAVLAGNPFASHPRNHTYALFLDATPSQSMLDEVRHRTTEELALGERVIYVAYPAGIGQSKLVIPAARFGTARNLNTVAKLAALVAGRPSQGGSA